jgi:hypothetical protein
MNIFTFTWFTYIVLIKSTIKLTFGPIETLVNCEIKNTGFGYIA